MTNDLRPPSRAPHYDHPWRRGSVGPSGSTERHYGWVRILPSGWVEFHDPASSPHSEPVVTAYSPAALVVVTYLSAWEEE